MKHALQGKIVDGKRVWRWCSWHWAYSNRVYFAWSNRCWRCLINPFH
jgi:hypothetical protein